MKLTNQMRDEISEKILDHAFKARLEQLEKDEIVLGDEIYEYVVPKADQKIMETLPDNYFYTHDWVRANYEDYRHATKHFSMSKERKFPAEKAEWVWDGQHTLAGKIQKYMKKAEDLKEEMKTAKAETKAVLKQVNTDKQLLQIWPEIAEFVPQQIGNNNYPVPAIRINDLNKKLGIKKTKKHE